MAKKDKKRKQQQRNGGEDEYQGSGGLLMSMRGGIKNVAGTGGASGPRTGLKRVGDILFWVMIVALLALAFSRFGR